MKRYTREAAPRPPRCGIVHVRDNFHGNGPEARGHAVDCRRPADAELMSAAASPGRTWFIFLAERRLSVLAGAPAAAFLRRGGWRIGVSGVGGEASSAHFAHLGDEDHSRSQFGVEWLGYR